MKKFIFVFLFIWMIVIAREFVFPKYQKIEIKTSRALLTDEIYGDNSIFTIDNNHLKTEHIYVSLTEVVSMKVKQEYKFNPLFVSDIKTAIKKNMPWIPIH